MTHHLKKTFENTITISINDFAQFALVDFLATVGGSAGLWVGMGALQALEMSRDFLKIFILGKPF